MDQRVAIATDQHPKGAFSSVAQPYFDVDIVVSRDAMGNPLSRYGDSFWNYSAQSIDSTSGANLHFFEGADAANRDFAALMHEQHKALMWLHIDAGKVRALKTVQLANYTLSVWCDRASARRVNLFELLIDPELLAEELGSLPESYLDATSTLIKTLWRHCTALHVDAVPLQQLKERITAERKGRPPGMQTPLIPSRIYCAILAGLIAGLDEIERDLENLLNAYRESAAASRAAPEDASPAQKKAFRANVLVPTVECMKDFGYEPLQVTLTQFIVGRISMYQSKLMHTVAAFSGMRVGEVCILPLHDVIETFEHRGSVHYVILGYTHKLNGGITKPTSWITSREGHRAVVLAQRIASTILEVLGGKPSKGQQALLFPSTESPFRRKNSATVDRYQKLLIETICPPITQEDMDELDRLELDRGWQRDGIEVGNRWPLAFHQLRRSLSVYAHRSGMVSLPALKAQLQHITDEMRAYYANGYSRAVNLVWDKDHISREWEAAKAESSYFGYSLALLFSDDDLMLMGRGADRMANTIATRSRKETLQLFRHGKLAYKETVLGGCVSIEECKAMPLEPIPISCLETSCVNQVVFGKRLDHVIRTQETVVATLGRDELGSVEHRLEAGHLQVLLKARQQLVERAA